MSDIYYHPSLLELSNGSSSGYLVHSVSTSMGDLDIYHGVMGTDGYKERVRVTSLKIGDLPQVTLPGTIKVEDIVDPVAMYWQNLILFGGHEAVSKIVEKTYKDGIEVGGRLARARIRAALSF